MSGCTRELTDMMRERELVFFAQIVSAAKRQRVKYTLHPV